PETAEDTDAAPVEVSAPPATIEKPESTASRLVRLRQRLAEAPTWERYKDTDQALRNGGRH
ncbi:MAG TPA: hypothetical protein VJR48_08090, partial [Ktedonobacterales bacterium]|nr:hypothetical protein [Ktedonobacterales bacterium]